MSIYNIEMNSFNGSSYDVLYPRTVLNNVTDWANSIYSKSQVDSQISQIENNISNLQNNSLEEIFGVYFNLANGTSVVLDKTLYDLVGYSYFIFYVDNRVSQGGISYNIWLKYNDINIFKTSFSLGPITGGRFTSLGYLYPQFMEITNTGVFQISILGNSLGLIDSEDFDESNLTLSMVTNNQTLRFEGNVFLYGVPHEL